jgi:PAS domain S-box-containing protein
MKAKEKKKDTTSELKREIELDRLEMEQKMESALHQPFLLAELLEKSAQPFAVGYPDGHLGPVNQAFCDLVGYSRDELVSASWLRFTPAKWHRAEFEFLETLRRTGKPVRYKKEYVRKDGYVISVELFAHLLNEGPDGSVLYYAFVTDITERKNAEKELKLKSMLLDSAMDSVLVHDELGNYYYVNKAAYETRGYTKDELLSMNLHDVVAPEYRDLIEPRVEEIKRAGGLTFETVHLRKDGTQMPVEISAKYVEIEDHEMLFSITKDISERKQKEEEIRFRSELLDSANDSVFVHDENGTIMYINETAYTSRGYLKEELMGIKTRELVSPEYLVSFDQEMEVIRSTRHGTFETAHVCKDGSIIPLEVHAKYIEYQGKALIYCSYRDISERKQNVQALRESEDRYRKIIQTSPIGIHSYRSNGKGKLELQDANPSSYEILGYEEDEIVGRPIREIFQGAMDEQSEEIITSITENGDSWQIAALPVNILHRHLLLHIHAFQSSPGNAILTLEDVTSQVESERKIEESETRYRGLIESAPVGILICEHKSCTIIYANPASCHLLGCEEQDIEGRPLVEVIQNPELSERSMDYTSKQENLPEDINLTNVKVETPRGTNLFIDISTSYISIDDKICEIVFLSDVTSRALADEIIQKSYNNLQSLFDSIEDFVFIFNQDGQIVKVNSAVNDRLGYSSEDLEKMQYAQFHPAEIQPHFEQIFKAVANKQIDTFPLPLIAKNGLQFPVETRFSKTRWGNEEFTVAFARDVSELLKAYQQLRESEERFRAITEQSLLGIIIIEGKRLKYINNAAMSIIDLDQPSADLNFNEMIINRIHPDDAGLFKNVSNAIMSADANGLSPFTIRIRTGIRTGIIDLHYIEVFPKFVSYEGNDACLIIINDVTEKTKEKMLIDESQRKVHALFKYEMEKMRQIDQIRTEFVYRASHELRTPLNAICSAISLLQESIHKLSDADIELFEIIRAGGDRLKHLIESLVESFRMEVDLVPIYEQNADLVQVIGQAVRAHTFFINQRHHSIALSLPEILNVKLDREKIEVMIGNLLMNAINNTPPGGTITISMVANADNVTISVADTGIGITPDEMPRLFQKFGKIER